MNIQKTFNAIEAHLQNAISYVGTAAATHDRTVIVTSARGAQVEVGHALALVDALQQALEGVAVAAQEVVR